LQKKGRPPSRHSDIGERKVTSIRGRRKLAGFTGKADKKRIGKEKRTHSTRTRQKKKTQHQVGSQKKRTR